VTRHHSRRVSPFGHPRIHARLTTPRGISQPPTSFIGSQCQGIHHVPLNTYNTKPKAKKNCTTNKHNTTHQPVRASCSPDARNHYPQIKHHTPPPKTRRQPTLSPVSHTRDEEIAGLLSQSPIVCLAVISSGYTRTGNVCCAPNPRHYSGGLLHGPHLPNGGVFSWCSLERR
jgi:hypothetical protein